jgi:putative copper resistance protein D
VVSAALILCRFAHYAAAMLLFGAGAFLWVLAPAGLARALNPTVRHLAAGAIVVGAISAAAWLALEVASMGDGWPAVLDPATVAAVLDTSFGHVWRGRLVLALVLAGLVAFGRHDRWPLVVPLAALFLGSLGLVGHAAMQSGTTGILHRACDAVHLLAAGAWVGGLVPLVLSLAPAHPELRKDAGIALRRFSGMGHVAVALVLLTGVVNVRLVLGGWPLDPTSPYQALLLTKIGLVAAMIGLALINRYLLVPRIAAARDTNLARLRLSTLAEIALGGAVLALVAAFGTLDPS